LFTVFIVTVYWWLCTDCFYQRTIVTTAVWLFLIKTSFIHERQTTGVTYPLRATVQERPDPATSFSTVHLIPNDCCRRHSKMSSTQSKAALRSSRPSSVTPWRCVTCGSEDAHKSALSVEWWRQYVDCRRGSWSCAWRWSTALLSTTVEMNVKFDSGR